MANQKRHQMLTHRRHNDPAAAARRTRPAAAVAAQGTALPHRAGAKRFQLQILRIDLNFKPAAFW